MRDLSIQEKFDYSGEVKTSTEFSGPPSDLFVRMAELWRGWDGELRWESSDGLNGLLSLVARCDSLGHICVTVELRESWTNSGYRVKYGSRWASLMILPLE